VPKEGHWAHLQASAKQPTIGKIVVDAMVAIERDNCASRSSSARTIPAPRSTLLGATAPAFRAKPHRMA